MNKIKLILFMFCVLFFSQLVQAEKVSLVTSIWPPYVDKALPDDGLAMKIVKTAFKRVGYTPEVRIEAWEKALAGSKLGVYDVAGAIWKSDSRKQKLLFSDSYLTNNIVLVANSNSQVEFNSLNDLQGLLVGVLKGYEYDPKFMKDPKILKFKANRLTQNLISVQQGKLDLAVADRRLALYELKHFMGNNRSDFRFLPKALSSRKLYIAAPIENAESKKLIAKFNQGLAAIKKDGTYQKILDTYTF
ncbi:MAG: transporter substrate-binding domain-containing protein [Gammaproteobacteria bacterium]|nr:transporter substrate-binding domain-containing protein [Gammaproteobacteria bacterium]